MLFYVKCMFIYVKIKKNKISSSIGYKSLSTKLLQNMNEKTYEKLSVSYIKQHFTIMIKYDREKYFLTTDKTEIH